MTPAPLLFDAQIHPATLSDRDLLDLAYFGVRGAIAVPGYERPGAQGAELGAWLDEWVRVQPGRMRKAGIAPFLALGVHPSQVRARGLEEILAQLPELFDRERVVAVGAIGLESGGAREEEVFGRQLEIAKSLGTRVLVHTPSRDKLRMTRRLLALLRESGIDAARVAVGQADGSTIRLILACGHFASLAVGPVLGQAEEAVRWVRQLGSRSLLLASDVGAGPGDLLALPRTIHLMERAGLSPEVVRRVGRTNALAFFGIDPSALMRA